MRNRMLTIVLLFMSFSYVATASHITGGEMFYQLISTNNGEYQYRVTLKLFQRCNSGRQFPDPSIISIFEKTNNLRVIDLNVPITSTDNISLTNTNPCITNPPVVCYDVAYYTFTISLRASTDGYVIASQVNYRINGINNLSLGSGNVGATYTAEIPGNGSLANGPTNNSAYFTGNDLVVICANNNFTYSFAAEDTDNDLLRYSFGEAYGSTGDAGGTTLPTNPPPFPSVPYNFPDFSSTTPLGLQVHIDPNTGIITGIAPAIGIYVVTVSVEEIRNGKVIARQRKDIQINVADCDIASASLLPDYSLCKNTQTITLANQSNSPLIVTTDWQFIDNTGSILFASSSPSVTYTFPSIGVYSVKLIINKNQTCTDSTSAIIRVFPGFIPDFNFSGICFTKPTSFTDNTTSVFGTPDSWTWDFGDTFTTTDISSLQNPSYTYPELGTKNVRLIATDSKGCRDTIYKPVNIIEKPLIDLAFRDTLICLNDQLLLQAEGSGIFSWSPPININNANTATPTVFPNTSTTYYTELDDNGCKNIDSVRVNVVDHVSLSVMNDTTICVGDTIQLRIISDGLKFNWSPSAQLINSTVKNPFAISGNTTNYQVIAAIGGCTATENIRVITVPYPKANAGEDVILCYNGSQELKGSADGSSWSWEPAAYLSNAALLNPVASPPQTTVFVLTTYDTKGCPKPGQDTVKVIVLPKMRISAGADTTVVINQPVQLTATGGIAYSWSPPDYLSATNIPDPVALFTLTSEDIRYKVTGYNEEGCSDSAFLTIKVYKTIPTIFVPTAFTPNNDGRNDVLRPVAAGIKSIEFFNIYNRWGQLVFSTKINGHGWDGKINGQIQASGAFVWMVKATDYTDKPYFQKGIVTLIR